MRTCDVMEATNGICLYQPGALGGLHRNIKKYGEKLSAAAAVERPSWPAAVLL